MPFDPTLPQELTMADAAQMRAQFNGLAAMIAAVPGLTDVVIDSVTTLDPGEPASATASMVGTVLHLTLAIPRGDEGVQGVQGIQGPPFANAIVDAVNILPPGSAATVSVSFDGTDVHFTFGIPVGADGAQGPPGEVTNAQLAAAISMAVGGTSNNTNAVPTMDTPFTNDPPTLPDMATMRTAYNALVLALRRRGERWRTTATFLCRISARD